MLTTPSPTADSAGTPLRPQASRRLARILVVLCILTGATYAAAPGAYAAFGLSKLVLDSKTGSENYLFTSGNTVFAQGNVDGADSKVPGRAYQFTFTDASGATRSVSPCTANGTVNNAAVWSSYTLTASDPLSTSTSWRVVLRQYSDSRCTAVEKTSTAVNFQVAKLTAYANSSLTTPIGILGPQASGYVQVAGVGQGQTSWTPTWLARGGTTACANTAGSDRPASDANGILPSGTGAYLQYPPATTGATWNLAKSYDAACAAFSSANDGAWSLALRKDATHFVTLPAFSVDASPPASSSTSPAASRASDITVSYTASDGTGSGLAGVDLYAKGPADIGYAKVATDSQPGASGSFAFSATKGDGRYSFYTITTDKLGNVEAVPSSADSSTAIDTVTPTSMGNSPQYSGSKSVQVAYTASDPGAGASGLAKVDLYVRRPGDDAYAKAATDTSPGSSGTLAYTAAAGDGPYAFYTVATDAAGNTEAAAGSPDATTTVDTATPASQASSPASTTSRNLQVTYTASGTDGSGLATIDLYAKGPGDAAYAKVLSDPSPATSGSFAYSAPADGRYSFYTVAADKAGNVEGAPGGADASTTVDTATPASTGSSPQYSSSNGVQVAYTADDPGTGASGLAKVDLYVRRPGDGAYAKAATDTSPGSSGTLAYTAAAGDGPYAFYTVATDQTGNTEAAPSSADATTTVDTAAPTSRASSPASTSSRDLKVTYTASDTDGSGLAEIDLYAKAPDDNGFSKVATDSSPTASGSFAYHIDGQSGSYRFYTRATDKAGNAEPAPAIADTTTDATVNDDIQPPTSLADAPASSRSAAFDVSYTASDGAGSGVAKVDLYAQAPGDSGYAKVATDSTPTASGTFRYTAAAGDGRYSFYTVATDQTGNVEAAPDTADASTALDSGAPTSTASSPQYSSSNGLQVSYTADDPGTGASGLAKVDLYVRRPGDGAYTKAATDSSPSASGTLAYTAGAGDGPYAFYTVATDGAGNTEAAPSSADATTTVDTATPTSHASSPASTGSGRFDVTYTAGDAGGSGLAKIDLYAKGPGDAAYSKVSTDSTPGGTGSLSFDARSGDGRYSFYTRATDKAGNAEAAPSSPDSETWLDTAAPASLATAPQYATASAMTVSYTASDTGNSGLATVALYAKGPGAASYTKVGTDAAPAGSGSFNFTAATGEGAYSFYTVATDQAGNSEATPGTADATTVFDTTPPASAASSGSSANTTAVTVTYTASDGSGGSGTAKVDLYAKGPGDTAFSKAATDATPGASGSFAYTASKGVGDYSFYTVASDSAGNVESAPGSADSTTTYNPSAGTGDVVDEAHYTYTGPTSVAFDWRGSQTDIRYGRTASYSSSATAHAPDQMPFSSPGPFQEVELTGLQAGTTYHYSIGGGVDHTFSTPPTGDFRFDVEADIGSSLDYKDAGTTQSQISADNPDFVLAAGDLTYGTPFGQASVDRHFNDVMAWSSGAAYMPVWGNHEYEDPTTDDLRNYKGRFMLPHAQTSPSAPAGGCCGEDWSWFDAGGVRFISYPEPYASKTWTDWQSKADVIFAGAQADPSIHFIVTFGHRPAFSTGFHSGEVPLQSVLNGFGDTYSKYVLNLNGHSHDYERYVPIHGVTHITTGGGGGSLETPWTSTDSRTAFRAFHLEHMRIDVSSTGMRVDAICGPPTSRDDIACVQGSVIDSYTIGSNPPPAPPPPATLYVDKGNAGCSDGGAGTAAQPFCSIKPATSRVAAGQTVRVGSGTYNEQVTPTSSGTPSEPINFVTAPGATVKLTGVANGISISAVSNISVQGFDVSGTTGDGIVVKNASNITLRGNHVSNSGQPVSGKIAKGIRVDGVTDSTVANNKVDHNTDYGIYLVSSTRNQVTGNQVSAQARVWERAASGIRLYGSPSNTISSNVSHDNEDSGLEFFTGSNGNVVTNNVAYNNGDHGIDDYSSTGQQIVANSVYNNATAGINLENASTGAQVANNISVDNGIGSTRTKGNIRVDSTSTTGATVDYDIVKLRVSGTMMTWGSTAYPTLAAFVKASAQEKHGLEADPLWQAAGQADFHLTAASPAIDSANSGASGEPDSDADGNPRIDDSSVANSGVGPRAFDDRGAFEYQPGDPPDSPPSVSFTVSPSGGPAPLKVTADAGASTDTDNTPIESYTFDFGDGSPVAGPQAGATASHTYTGGGIYTVKVTVTDTNDYASSSTTQIAVSDSPPKAALSVTPSSGTAPVKVSADASASSDSDDTPIDTYKFDFGDGSAAVGPQAGATADHTYTAAGTYTVKVTVADTAGNASSATRQVNVSAPLDAPPTARLAMTPTSGAAPLDVTADASASTDTDSTPVDTYKFDFGDGSTAVGPQAGGTANHTYTDDGTYSVTVTVSDTAGNSSTATTTVTVTQGDAPPAALLTVTPTTGTAPLNVSADASASTDGDDTPIDTYKFDFGDGSAAVGPQAGATASHRYTTAGTYTVKATVTDTAGNSSTATTQVTVSPPPDAPPSASLTLSPRSGTAPLDVTADASASTDTDDTPISTYKFDFGDGSAAVGPQAGATASHRYTAAGTYTVKATVADTAGNASSATTQIKVSPADLAPSAALTVTPATGLAPVAVTADASASTDTDDTPIATYKFEFGDGTAAVGPQAGATATHNYVLPGTYTATVTVTDTGGKFSKATAQVTAVGNLVANPGFETNTTGWNTSGGATGNTVTRVAGGHSGNWSAQLSNTTAAAATCLLNDSPNAVSASGSGTYTGTLWVRADTAGASLKLRFREYTNNNTTLAGTATTTVTLTTGWQQVAVTYVPTSPGASTIDFNAFVSSAAPGTCFYADDAIVYLG